MIESRKQRLSAYVASQGGRFYKQLAFVAVLSGVVWLLADRFGGQHHLFDLRIYRKAVTFWLAGNDIYDYSQPDVINGTLGYTYPPFAAVLMSPMGVLPYGFVKWFTIGTTLLVAILTTYWIMKPVAMRRGWPVWFATSVTTALIFALEPIRETMSFGQINLYLVALVLGDLLILGGRGSKWTGVGIGVATAIKLTPGFFILYLLVTRRWRAAGVSVAAAGAATLLAAALDWHSSWRFYTSVLWDTERVGFPDNPGNQAINGMVARIDDMVPVSSGGKLVWLVLALAVGGYGLWRAAQAHRAKDELAAITITGLAGVAVSPVSWTHHLYWIVPALVILVDVVLDAPGEKKAWWRIGLINLVYWSFTMSLVWFFRRTPGHHRNNNLPSAVGENAFAILIVALLVFTPFRLGIDGRAGSWARVEEPEAQPVPV
ncbi:glycosyltransferase family 87 protein [Longispora sp. NPDC051575]|uniref:glycosyltransferase family 87 protein n=1 Tax=Longispora sp. NPDC051575 TaxID=3154943 RepID=UPI003437617C